MDGSEARLAQNSLEAPVLVGMRGSGKTSVAPVLAKRLGTPWVDADQEIVRRHGKSIRTLFCEIGETGFRALERDLLVNDLLLRDCTIATGGGAVTDETVRQQLMQRFTVWLHADVDILASRVLGSGRPSLTGRPVDIELHDILTEREPLYRESSTLAVDTSRKSISAIVDEICDFAARHGHKSKMRRPPIEGAS